ncbi:AraC family transcriptional regulator, partial [Sphingobacterium shayense]|uniref:AraC family ligand binding domain-containing protein n=1 Tax=Sphingobacterium shayense TaxID=626343 RepID=UPI001552735A
MVSKIPIIEQCTVSGPFHKEILVEDLAGYLKRNRDLIFPHRHNFYHFLLFTKGSGRFSLDFEAFDVEAWRIYFMSPGQIHTWAFDEGTDGYIVNFDKDLFKTFLVRSEHVGFFSFFSGRSKDDVFTIREDQRASVLNIFERLRQNMRDLDFGRVSLLYLFHVLEKQRDPVQKGEVNKINHTLLRNFMDLIEIHFKTLKLPKDYASLLYITPNHLNAVTKEQLGYSAGELIRNRVLLEAKRLLVMKNFSIAE